MMGTQKWHMPDHMADNIRKVEDAEYLQAGIYGSAQGTFKRQYRRSSRIKNSTFEETLGKSIKAANAHRFKELKCKSDKDKLQ